VRKGRHIRLRLPREIRVVTPLAAFGYLAVRAEAAIMLPDGRSLANAHDGDMVFKEPAL
jgi:hypothetical protein